MGLQPKGLNCVHKYNQSTASQTLGWYSRDHKLHILNINRSYYFDICYRGHNLDATSLDVLLPLSDC